MTDTIKLPLKYRLLKRGLQTLAYTLPPIASNIALDMFSTPTRRAVRSGKTKQVLESAVVSKLPFTDPDLPAFADLSLNVRTWGANNTGPSVLLAHGWEGQAGSFRDFVPALEQAGCRVVA
ncbi:MAG: hypothetical protein AAF125_27415, partial [Chloroflexota bacterium]